MRALVNAPFFEPIVPARTANSGVRSRLAGQVQFDMLAGAEAGRQMTRISRVSTGNVIVSPIQPPPQIILTPPLNVSEQYLFASSLFPQTYYYFKYIK